MVGKAHLAEELPEETKVRNVAPKIEYPTVDWERLGLRVA
jgi:hypothetical protein